MTTSPRPPSRPASVGWLILLLGVCFLVAFVGAMGTMDGVRTWYPTLDKPPWTPPNQAFGPIWTTLYTAMAVAMWRVIAVSGPGRDTLGWFTVQLALNAAWSPIFFAWQLTGLALVVISLMWFAILGCIVVFWRHSRVASALMVPYLAWVSVAWSLNGWIFWFN